MEQSVCNLFTKLFNMVLTVRLLVKANDEVLGNALRQYHQELLTNNKKISARLLSEHEIAMRCVRLCTNGVQTNN